MNTQIPLPDGEAPRDRLGTLTSLAIGVVIVVALYVGRDVLVPITLAILLSFVLAPLVQLLRRLWLGRVPAVFLAVALALGVILSMGGLIAMQVSELVADVPRYAYTVDQKVMSVRTLVLERVTGLVGKLGQQFSQLSAAPEPQPAQPSKGAPAAAPKTLPVEIHQPDPTPLEIAQRILTPVVSQLATTGIVFIVTIFILLQQADLRDRFIRLFGLRDLHRTTSALDETAHRLSRYLLSLLGMNALFGVIVGFGMLLIGVPNPLLWGTLGALFRFVPYIGSVMAGLLPALLAAAVDPGWGMALQTVALFVATEAVMGQFLDPLVFGLTSGLSPISVVIAAIFWAWLWGPIGLILSMPLTLCLVVLGRHVQQLEFLDVLLGNRPALTPVESFYQRILANDPDEALEYAEGLLKDRSLSTYYDEVAIAGLRRAATDAERGVLGAAMLTRIQSAVERLVGELDVFDDTLPVSGKPRADVTAGVDTIEAKGVPLPAESDPIDPAKGELAAAWSASQPVLCVSGSGPFDPAVTDMMVQLLIKNGLGARAVPFAAASREAIGGLDLAGVALVCICYLDISVRPSQVRYLIRRLRQAIPRAPFLVGLWPGEDARRSEERARAAVGADHHMVSLREGVNCCLALARDGVIAPVAPAIAREATAA